MCGLVTVVPKYNTRGLTYQEMTVFDTLVTIDTLRGEDSTGIFTANYNEVSIVKDVITGPQLLLTKEYKELRTLALKNGKFIVAHNRKATRGVINDRNAHPFWKDNKVVMVHNGTFNGDHKKHADTEVDSEALCHLLAEHEPSEVDQVLGKINAAYAVIWFDARDDSLNIVRNDQRPLYMWETTSSWYFSSESLMLHFAMMRCNITLPEGSRPKLLEEHEQYKFVFKESQTKLEVSKLTLPFRHSSVEDEMAAMWERYGNGATQQHHRPTHRQGNVANACAYDATKEVVLQQQQQQQQIPHTSVQHQQRMQAAAPGPLVTNSTTGPARYSGTTFGDKIVDDLGVVTMLPFSDFNKYRENFTTGAQIEFNAKNIVPLDNQQYIIYGTSDIDEDVIVGALINGDDFSKLIEINNRRQKLRGRIQVTLFKNMIGTIDTNNMAGAIIVQLNNISKIESEGEHCGC